nr:aldehyde dehydrogenase family protein [Plesiocystis pacifica]
MPPKPSSLVSFSPKTGARLGEVPVAAPEDVAATVARARLAQVEWAGLDVEERNARLLRFREVLLARADEIAARVSEENGKPAIESMGLLAPICATIELHTDLAKRLARGQKVSPTFFLGARAVIHHEPLGVAGFILPWNFPFELGVKHMIPALAAGNAVVQKPSQANPLIGELIVRLFAEAGLPKDLVQVVHGYAETGKALVDAADTICFVGSTATGKQIMRQAAETLTPVLLELGGNDAAIVRRDADIPLTARGLINSTCYNAGQVCNGVERIYVPHELIDPLLVELQRLIPRLRLAFEASGDDYELGPFIWPPQLEVYEEHTADALAKGAKVHCGGEVVRRGGGLYWPPTLLTGMTHEMLMMREETFGPFIAIMSVSDDDEAVALANDSRYGLGASVWTRDTAAGEALARRLRAGSVMINNAMQIGGCATLPFGGDGDSGVGRAQGEQVFFHYVATKSVMTSPGSSASLWMPYGPEAQRFFRGLSRTFYASKLGARAAGIYDLIVGRPQL